MAALTIHNPTRPLGGGVARKSVKVNSTKLPVTDSGGRWWDVSKVRAHPACSMESIGRGNTVSARTNTCFRPKRHQRHHLSSVCAHVESYRNDD